MSSRVSWRKTSSEYFSVILSTWKVESLFLFFFLLLFILIFDMCHYFCNQWSLYQGKNCPGQTNLARPTHTMNLSGIINIFFLKDICSINHTDLQPRCNILYNTENNLVKEHKYATWLGKKILSCKNLLSSFLVSPYLCYCYLL